MMLYFTLCADDFCASMLYLGWERLSLAFLDERAPNHTQNDPADDKDDTDDTLRELRECEPLKRPPGYNN
jgi:hypothetical protein